MIFLIRHAQAEHNVNNLKVAGQAMDSPLTDEGKAQSKKLGQLLSSRGIDTIYHSPALRCIETAKIASLEFKKPPKLIEDEKLLEMHQGGLVGKSKILTVLNPIIFFKILLHGKDYAFKGGETFNQVANRMHFVISNITKEEKDKNVAIITHGMAMRALMAKRYKWSVWKIILKKIKNIEIIEWT